MKLTDMEESIQQEAEHKCNIVQLKPYDHQVGGHNCMLKYDDKTLCKPLNEQEHVVYSNTPDSLKEFFPNFYGVVTVRFEKNGDKILCYAMPLDCSYCKDENRFRNYLLAIDAWQEGKEDSRSTKVECSQSSKDSYNEALKVLFKDRLLRTWNKYVNNGLGKFILLENISKDFHYPCSIDLKMGTRGSGDIIASLEKYERHVQRVNQSTSASLGVRFCGMRVYNCSRKEYTFTDKYKGRTIDESGFISCLKDFIYNGNTHRKDLIKPIITKLKTLLQNLENIDSYRFYCSSLLIIYDGCDSDNQSNVELRMIDFAQSRVKQESTNHHRGPDNGYILGVRNLIRIFTSFLDEIKNGGTL